VSNYASGTRFELKTRHDLEDNGYVVSRAAGSKGKIDLWACKPGELLMVQCKSTPGLCGPEEWDRVVELAGWVGGVPLLAVNGPGGRGVRYWRLVGLKRRGRRFDAQPIAPFLPDALNEAALAGQWLDRPVTPAAGRSAASGPPGGHRGPVASEPCADPGPVRP
jgi:Holliday junction resolvase